MSLTASVSGGAPASAATGADLANEVDAAVAGFPGRASVVLTDPGSGVSVARDADRVVPAASLYKLPVMIEAYRRAAAGGLSLDDTLTVSDSDLGPDGYLTPSGVTLSIRDAIERMITISDNATAHALLRLLDSHAVNATARALGLTRTVLNTTLPEAERTADFNTTTAHDLERLFAGLLAGTIVSSQASAEMLGILERQQINDRLPSGLPDDARIAHKTGNLPGVAHDAGVIWSLTGPRVVVMLTTDFASYDDVVSLAEQIAAAAYATPLDRIAARYDLMSGARLTVLRGATLPIDLKVTNAGTTAWGPMAQLKLVWHGASGTSSDQPGPAWSIGGPVGPGGQVVVHLAVPAPASPGTYVLSLEAVDPSLGASGNELDLVISVVAQR